MEPHRRLHSCDITRRRKSAIEVNADRLPRDSVEHYLTIECALKGYVDRSVIGKNVVIFLHFKEFFVAELKFAYFILCHKMPEQVIRLINRLSDGESFCVVHIDKRAAANVYDTLKDFSANAPNIYLTKRRRCYWGHFGIVQATISCIQIAMQLNLPFDYAFLLSGQDYPIKKSSHIKKFLSENMGREFIESFPLDKPNRWSNHGGPFNPVNRVQFWTIFLRSRYIQIKLKRNFPLGFRPHGGSQWWCLSRDCIKYLKTFIVENPSFVRYFRWVFIPDEIFFQSILSNSPYRDKIVSDDLRYADWDTPNPNYPRTLDISDLEKLKCSPDLFARKFDTDRSRELLNNLDNKCIDRD